MKTTFAGYIFELDPDRRSTVNWQQQARQKEALISAKVGRQHAFYVQQHTRISVYVSSSFSNHYRLTNHPSIIQYLFGGTAPLINTNTILPEAGICCGSITCLSLCFCHLNPPCKLLHSGSSPSSPLHSYPTAQEPLSLCLIYRNAWPGLGFRSKSPIYVQ
jgi:hypothetical protein